MLWRVFARAALARATRTRREALMSDPVFFRYRRALAPSLAEIVSWSGADVAEGADLATMIRAVAPLDAAEPGALTVFDATQDADALARTRASACFVDAGHASRLPPGTVALVTADPARAFAAVAARLFPDALRPAPLFAGHGIDPGARVHPEARLEPGVAVDPGVVIAARAEIGMGSIIGANSVIGPDVRIGRGCAIGAQVTLTNALLGDGVVVATGARLGQDSFDAAPGRLAAARIAHIGRVIVQDRVEIGANTVIDRGSTRDTVVGEGTRIDNLVRIAHNVAVGRFAIVAAQASLADGVELADRAVVGVQAAVAAHVRIGAGAIVAAGAAATKDVPAR
jgi:UDP-3-O-[3-hydroxymyristoyl] glucosamine N-acyltransferase